MSEGTLYDSERRILAFDYGKKRIGVAVSDPLNMFAIPIATFVNNPKLFKNIENIFKEYSVTKVVIGLPYREDGSESVLSEEIHEFARKVEDKFPVQVVFIDERYSSRIAEQQILESVKSRKKRRDKGLVDRNAAAVILTDFLGN